MVEITHETVKFVSNEITKAFVAAIEPMISAISDEEFEKIPHVDDYPHVKEVATKYGISMCGRLSKDEYTEVLIISSAIFRGERKSFTNSNT